MCRFTCTQMMDMKNRTYIARKVNLTFLFVLTYRFFGLIIFPVLYRRVIFMIVEVKELDYLGFHLEYVENKGWQIVLKDVAVLFPTLQDAQAACREFFSIASKSRGKKILYRKNVS